MTQDLRSLQASQGATFTPGEDGIAVPLHFGQPDQEVQAAQHQVALLDRSHWGRIEVSDADRLRYLHNQSTNDFYSLQPGQGCDTVFVTSTARTIDLVTAYVLPDRVMLLVSPNRRQALLAWLDRYIFFADKVKLTDATETTLAFSLLGNQALSLLETLGVTGLEGSPYASHQALDLQGIPVRLAIGSGLVTPGYTLITSQEQAVPLWQRLTEAGARPMGEMGWQQLRIQQGRPMPDRELTEDYNPLEAGLWSAISFNKGCYIGQETIARLDTYKGVKLQLWGVQLQAPVELGSAIYHNGEKVGTLTSYAETDQGIFGLAYIRTKAGGEGLTVTMGETEGHIIPLSYIRHQREV